MRRAKTYWACRFYKRTGAPFGGCKHPKATSACLNHYIDECEKSERRPRTPIVQQRLCGNPFRTSHEPQTLSDIRGGMMQNIMNIKLNLENFIKKEGMDSPKYYAFKYSPRGAQDLLNEINALLERSDNSDYTKCPKCDIASECDLLPEYCSLKQRGKPKHFA
jgi:hypothetical protein